jgi:hypothetical protein
MKSKYLILLVTLVCISCSNTDDDLSNSNVFEGRYTHEISNCDNSGNPEINCIEFIEFIDESKVDVLIGGGDMVIRTNYLLDKKTIKLEKVLELNFDVSFNIQDEETLIRIEDNELWLKTE